MIINEKKFKYTFKSINQTLIVSNTYYMYEAKNYPLFKFT